MARTVSRDNQGAATSPDGGSPLDSAPLSLTRPGPSGINLTSSQWFVLGVALVGLVTLVTVLAWGARMEYPADVGRDIWREIDTGVKWLTRE